MSRQAWFVEAKLDFQEFSAGSVRTFAVVEGKADSFPVVFLHGLPGNCFVWSQILQVLGRKRLAIAPDLPGFGRSKDRFAKKNPELTPQFARTWLAEMLQAQNIDRFDLVAHGFGCYAGLELFLQNPRRVRRICLINPLSQGTAASEGPFKWIMRRFSKPALHAAKSLSPDLEQDPLTAKVVKWTKQFEKNLTVYLDELKNFQGSLLLLWGKQDPFIQPKQIHKWISDLPQAEIYQLDNGGYFIPLEQADEVNRILKEFLE